MAGLTAPATGTGELGAFSQRNTDNQIHNMSQHHMLISAKTFLKKFTLHYITIHNINGWVFEVTYM